jgi:hypothetical protein
MEQRLGVTVSTFRSRTVSWALVEIGEVDLVVCLDRRRIAEVVRR